MLLVGLTGGVGSGKTSVSKLFKDEGTYVIDADQIARHLVRPYSDAWKEIREQFGDEILQENGHLNRKKLASIIFSDPGRRGLLNKILHPRIKEEIHKMINEIKERDSQAIIIIDAPLLIELNEHLDMDKVIVVISNEDKQIERIMIRDGLEKETVKRIIESQLPISEKIKVADFVIRNEGSLEELKKRVKEVFQELKLFALQKERLNSMAS